MSEGTKRTPKGDWRRVTRGEKCPICGSADWCLLAGPEVDPTAATLIPFPADYIKVTETEQRRIFRNSVLQPSLIETERSQ